MPSPSPASRSSYTPSETQVARIGNAISSRSTGSTDPSIVVSSAVRSGSGRSVGTAISSDRTRFQYAVDMTPILPVVRSDPPSHPRASATSP